MYSRAGSSSRVSVDRDESDDEFRQIESAAVRCVSPSAFPLSARAREGGPCPPSIRACALEPALDSSTSLLISRGCSGWRVDRARMKLRLAHPCDCSLTRPLASTLRQARLNERKRDTTIGRNKVNGASLNHTSVK